MVMRVKVQPALGHHHQALLDQVPGALALDAAAHELDVAGGHRLQAGDGLQRGGLAGAVGADQADQLALAAPRGSRP